MDIAVVILLLFLIYIVSTLIETNKIVKSNSDKLDKILNLLENDTDKKNN